MLAWQIPLRLVSITEGEAVGEKEWRKAGGGQGDSIR